MKTPIRTATCFSLISLLLLTNYAQAEVRRLPLANSQIQAEITPDIGGRLLSFSLLGQPNFLRVGEPVTSNPEPQVSPAAENVGYLGHEIWVGPQSQWWVQQDVNAERAAAKAEWPPDPFLILAKNTLVAHTDQKIVLQSPPSSVSGVQITKSYALSPTHRNSLLLNVAATNIRRDSVAWDIWFNTRTFANTQVYIPVASEQDVQVKNLENDVTAGLQYRVHKGIFTLDMMPPPAGKTASKGKLRIQPAQGWMAGFHAGQVFIIQFAHQPAAAIHPEQGQIELYNDYIPTQPNEGLLEMELHAPYKTLAAGETMQAEETWTILPYKGKATRDAQLAFLRQQAKALGLAGL